MAHSNDTASGAGQAQGNAPAGAAGPAVCAAEDLKDILQHIAERIADTDRRHSSALEQMQARLAALGEEARQVRARVPREFIPAFERVEEGLDMLADRIQVAAQQHADHRRHPQSAAQAPAPAPEAAPTPEMIAAREAAEAAARATAAAAQEIEQLIAAGAAAAAPVGEQMPLRSALPAGHHHHEPAAGPASAYDPFDVVDRTNPDAVEPWDAASAEALARVYETSEPGFMRRMPDPDAAHGAAPAAAPAPSAAGEPHGVAVERDWLEGRFADIARRVEQSLAEARPDNSLLALGDRFDQFEQRFGNVLGDVATRADVEGLRLVEAHINELAAHFEHAQAQLSRLDAIENQLHAVVERLSDRRFASLIENAGAPPAGIETLVSEAAERAMQRFAGAQQPAPNLDKLALLAAEQAVSRLSTTLQQPAPAAAAPVDDKRVGELRQMIEGFITERRQGEEHTATMLDTMQQAMIRVLDRIDAMELAQHQAKAQPAAPQEYVREQVRFNVPPGDAGAARAVDDARHAAEAAVAAAQHMPRQPGPGPDLPSGPVRMVETGAPDAGRIEPTLRAPRVLDEQTKDDFVAAARRARNKVQSQRPAEGLPPTQAAPQPVQPPRLPERPVGGEPSSRTSAPIGKTVKPTVEKAKDAGASFLGLPRKTLLGGAVAMMALVIAVSVGIKRADHGKAVVGAVAPVETTVPAAAAPTAAAQPGEPAVDTPPRNAQFASEPSATAPASPDGLPKPAMEFERKEFDNTKTDERAKPMSATAEDAARPVVTDRTGASTSEQAITGIMLQHGDTVPTPQDLDRLERQQRLANLSSELGAAAASPAALVVEQQMAPGQQDAKGSAASAGRSALDLPPATVGPLSLRLAAAKGDASAEFEVGARLAEGKGTSQNFAEAVKWYQRSAQRGFAQAQYRLGTLYERGLGVKTDLARARVWYKRAAEQGNIKSMHNLAVLSAGRQAGSPDYATAAQWFAEAADRGLADSQFNLAVLYESGLGVGKDMAQAYKWMALAARSGDRETVKRREALRSQLAAGELEKAEAMLRDWQPKAAELMANDARAAGEAWKQQQASDGTNG